MYKIERANPKPLYIQLEELIRNKIEEGEWLPHTAIPSEAELNKMFDVSRMTIRSACSLLVQEGLLYRVPGKGTFVADAKITTASLAYAGFREQLEQMGYETTTELLEFNQKPASRREAERLACEESDPIILIERLRFMKGEPISLHYSYIPLYLGENLTEKQLEEEQLCVLLEQQHGIKPVRIIETLESVIAREKEQSLFNINPNHPLLILEDVLYDRQNKPYEYSKVVFRGDKIKLRYEFKR